MNPKSAAQQQLSEERARLQDECERLRELVCSLQQGGTVPPHLDATAGLPSTREVAGKS